MFRPLFRAKADRKTLQEAAAAAVAEEEAKAAAAAALAARTEESRAMVVDALRATGAKDEGGPHGEGEEGEGVQGRPDDTDRPEQEEEEYEAWKLRELRRLARDAVAAENALKEVQETERRRHLSPEERAAEDAQLEAQGLKVFRKTKEKWGFLQKYYHKGAFFVDEGSVSGSDVRLRSVAEPTGEDAVVGDRTALPRVMQVRNFGRKGRTRWTHLAAEDTTLTGFQKQGAQGGQGQGSHQYVSAAGPVRA
jgi:microfibrillar-associated protein 1